MVANSKNAVAENSIRTKIFAVKYAVRATVMGANTVRSPGMITLMNSLNLA